VDQLEARVRAETGLELEAVSKSIRVRQRSSIGFVEIAETALGRYPKRSVLCLALFVGQAFLYNGITFNLGTLMSKFFHVASGVAPVFLVIYAAANFIGPLVLGRLFDTVGRVKMISTTYLGSAAMGLLLAGLFDRGLLGSWTFIAIVMATFFLASAGASAAYLTSSEVFPMETRALAIAFFYAVGTAIGGITGPLLFGPLISTGSVGLVALAFAIGSVLMIFGGVAELMFGVKAEGAQLEDIARPLTAEEPGAGAAGEASREAGADVGYHDGRVHRQPSRGDGARASFRRYSPGPGRLGTHPGITVVPPVAEEALNAEVMAVERALEEHGPVEREELARMVGARHWGPGAFSEALRLAVANGGARRISRRVYGPPKT
jgi:hypothetical protein